MAESARKPGRRAPVQCGGGAGAQVLLAPRDATDDVLRVFYRTVRAGQERLAGGGGRSASTSPVGDVLGPVGGLDHRARAGVGGRPL
jgi:hypothetical protein